MTPGMVLRLQDSEVVQEVCKYRFVTGTSPEDKKKQSLCAGVQVARVNNC